MPVSVPVDFSGVESRTSVKVPEGDYVMKLRKIEKTNAKTGDRNPMLVCDFEFVSGGKGIEGLKIRDRHILTKQSLWTLRNMLEAMGLKVPNGKMTLKEEQLVGRKVGVTISDGEEYKGRIRSEIDDYIPVDAVQNKVSGDTDAVTEDDDDEDEDSLGVFAPDEDDEDEDDEASFTDDDDVADEEEDDDDFGFDDDEDEEEGDEESEEFSFDEKDVREGKAAELKGYIKEAMEAGWEFDLPSKPKAADVREALLTLFEDEDDDEELEGYSLEDV